MMQQDYRMIEVERSLPRAYGAQTGIPPAARDINQRVRQTERYYEQPYASRGPAEDGWELSPPASYRSNAGVDRDTGLGEVAAVGGLDFILQVASALFGGGDE